MSGPAIINRLITANPAIMAMVGDPKSVTVGKVPLLAKLPAIAITHVGSTLTGTISRQTRTELSRTRVQVTVYARSEKQLADLLLLCKLGKGTHTGSLGPYYVNSVIPLGEGPQMLPGGDEIFEQSRDFMVTFAEAN